MDSEGEGVDDSDHDDVADGGHDGDPEPDGVAGHLLLVVGWGLGGGGGGCRHVNAGRGVEEGALGAVVVVGRGVHEGTRHHRDLRAREGEREREKEMGRVRYVAYV